MKKLDVGSEATVLTEGQIEALDKKAVEVSVYTFLLQPPITGVVISFPYSCPPTV